MKNMSILVPLFAAITPFILWPIEIILPYPYIVEEISKAILIFFLLKLPNREKILGTIMIGFLFSFSETVLYLFNVFSVGSLQTLFLRFIFTTPMHIVTSLIILSSALINKNLIILGVIIAALVHYIFNLLV